MRGARTEIFDQRADSLAGQLRGKAWADLIAYGASALGDHGLVWLLVAVARSRVPGPRRRRALWALGFTGVVTPVVNAALKRAVGRQRPESRLDPHPFPLRLPRSSSFPSGHTLAAWCAAYLLSDKGVARAGCYGTAAVISWSRVHTRQHHPSDVVAGAAVGLGVGALGGWLRDRLGVGL